MSHLRDMGPFYENLEECDLRKVNVLIIVVNI